LGKFWRMLRWKMLVYFMAIWSTLWPSGIFYGFLVYFKVIWYILTVLAYCIKKNLATLNRTQTPLSERLTQGLRPSWNSFLSQKRWRHSLGRCSTEPTVKGLKIWSARFRSTFVYIETKRIDVLGHLPVFWEERPQNIPTE
jgi:hypothetical protein